MAKYLLHVVFYDNSASSIAELDQINVWLNLLYNFSNHAVKLSFGYAYHLN
ncbi:hypothetical protein MXF21_02945 [Enterococcus casseliflavus]|uniref:hypothetical protein n=1 Tax=Enterococcus casseliflavus TaxID=37734 RepID=UPI002DB8C6B6|nr:hypothetical protein [Enterococcus casseliflavus]MEB6085073.1 hypothetical protein [Enterococcus casseliflavus]